ncbi:erythroblast NAD(P)(+)--arginine ADP-ribosyltransferase-like [Podarcis raffonei]|uniref:erythroblast NAD(P)(+)--arginine ADP-ribosyltransferase-like n=1 Tax=Podarcis raffonei TaxID=65483 RepID=UPI002329609A|nr:erythroblast NAD(P)(+)--arginine ADP-ribosyltransferase-like [Podarcis raffonei]
MEASVQIEISALPAPNLLHCKNERAWTMKSPLHRVLVLHLMGIFTGDNQVSHSSSPRQDRFLGNELKLDMALNSFDDQYEGCEQMMEKKIAQLNQTELLKNKIYANAWKLAANLRDDSKWPRNLKPEYAAAIMAYTFEDPKLYPDFNAAVREAGKSKEHYRNNFNFKTFHFLLTRALQALRISNTPSPPCYKVFRGVRNINFSATVDDTVRFGQFASSSRQEGIAQCFTKVGQPVAKTIFEIYTCHGVLIREFSDMPIEDEVLIPPYEQFRVVSSRKDENGTTRIQLRSAGKFSKYNCASGGNYEDDAVDQGSPNVLDQWEHFEF